MIFRIKHRWQAALAVALFGAAVTFLLGGWETLWPGEERERTPSVDSLLGLGVAGGAAALLLNGVLHEFFRRALGEPYRRRFRRHAVAVLGPMRWPEFLAGGLMAAIAEEPFFRGVLLQLFKTGTSDTFAILAAAAVFGVCHWLRFEFFPFWLWAVWEGVFFGILMVWSGSILVPMVAHGVHDLAAYRIFRTMVGRQAA